MIDHVKDRLEDYLTKIKKADNAEIPKIRSEFSNWYYLLSDDEKNAYHTAEAGYSSRVQGRSGHKVGTK